MELRMIIKEMNKLVAIRNYTTSKYLQGLRELDEKVEQLKEDLPDEIKIVVIDENLLMEQALLKGKKSLFDLAHKYKKGLDEQARIFDEIEKGKLADAEVHLAVHRNQSVRLELSNLGNELFKAVYADNDRFYLLASHINIIGENTLFKEK